MCLAAAVLLLSSLLVLVLQVALSVVWQCEVQVLVVQVKEVLMLVVVPSVGQV